ncbi:MAG: pilin [Burkholderiales bacterium]|nr:pilin [Burkholderiales bacterium]
MMVRVAATAVALCLFPTQAWANAGIGYLFPAIPALILALVPVIFLEAPVLAGILRLPLTSGLKLSAAVNVRSTLWGIVIAIVVDIGLIALGGGSMGPAPSRAALMGSLLPMFFITWWIERRAVVRKYPQLPPARSVNAVLAANALSYAALSALIILSPIFKFYDQMGYRDDISVANMTAYSWEEGIQAYWQKHKRFPERADDLGPGRPKPVRHVRTVTLESGGRMVVELSFPDEPELDRKHLIYEPRVVGDLLQWKCRTPDLPQRYAPYGCRDRDNEGK